MKKKKKAKVALTHPLELGLKPDEYFEILQGLKGCLDTSTRIRIETQWFAVYLLSGLKVALTHPLELGLRNIRVVIHSKLVLLQILEDWYKQVNTTISSQLPFKIH